MGGNKYWLGKNHTEKTKYKMREARKKQVMKPVSMKTRRKMSLSRKGIKFSEEIIKKLREAQKGEKGSNWQGGISWGYKVENAPRPKPESCEVCGRFGRICYDHNHKTGEFRGWLCFKCNIALGMIDDNPKTLTDLAKYIIKNI